MRHRLASKQERNIPIFADAVFAEGGKKQTFGSIACDASQVHTLFTYTIFILFFLCFQNNSHEEHLHCDYYSLCWGVWHLLRLYFLKDLVAFKTNAPFRYIHALVPVVFLVGSETALSHLIWILPASQLLQQETCMVQEGKWKGEWGGTVKPTWPFLSLPLGRHAKAWSNCWMCLFIWVIWTYFM